LGFVPAPLPAHPTPARRYSLPTEQDKQRAIEHLPVDQ
jgi:hypothetical protein